MSTPDLSKLSRRERQIMDQLFRMREGSVGEVIEGIDDPPSYSALRAIMGILVEKGYLTRKHDGPKYVYQPTMAPGKARSTAAKHLLETFFDDSLESAVAALIDVSKSKLSEAELNRLAAMIDQAKKEGR